MSRPTSRIVSVSLPLPPSFNSSFSGRGHTHRTAKTAAYKFWLRQVREMHGYGEQLARFTPGAFYGLWIDIPTRQVMRGDTDNRIKLLSDVLTQRELGVVKDDALMDDLYVHRLPGMPANTCGATVVHADDWREYVIWRMS